MNNTEEIKLTKVEQRLYKLINISVFDIYKNEKESKHGILNIHDRVQLEYDKIIKKEFIDNTTGSILGIEKILQNKYFIDIIKKFPIIYPSKNVEELINLILTNHVTNI